MSALAALALVAALAGSENRAWVASLELAGPLERVVVDCGIDGRLVWSGPLLDGERRTVELPLPVRVPLGAVALGRVPEPSVEVSGEGSVVWRGWVEPQPAARLGQLPPALRARPLPPLTAEGASTIGLAELALLALTGALGSAARRRPWLVLAIGAVGAASFVLWRGGTAARPADAGVIVIEGDLVSGVWCELRGARDRLELATGGRAALEVRPPGRALRLEASATASTVTALAPGAELFERRMLPASAPMLDAGANRLGTLAAAWLRTADGAWHALGPWERGAPLPDAAASPDAPAGAEAPGWLRAGLPPGRAAVIGRLAADVEGAAGTASRWARVSGLEPRAPRDG